MTIICKECSEYVDSLLNRGEITPEEKENIMVKRHASKSCSAKMLQINKFNDALEQIIQGCEIIQNSCKTISKLFEA